MLIWFVIFPFLVNLLSLVSPFFCSRYWVNPLLDDISSYELIPFQVMAPIEVLEVSYEADLPLSALLLLVFLSLMDLSILRSC